MWDRIRIGRSLVGRSGDGTGRRTARRPRLESLEGRPLMAALAPISNLSVPAQQGYTLPLDGSATDDPQTFTITSSNPDIPASVISGPVWTMNIQYTDPSNSANNFSGPLVFQLFNSADSQTLTNNTVNHIRQFTNDNYYTTTGKYITRVATGFPNSSGYVVQGGAPNPDGTGSSGQPNTPFANENLQPLAFTGTNQLAMANSGGTNSNDTQFFITTASPNSELGYNYTIFGQMIPNPTPGSTLSDQTVLTKLTKIPTKFNPGLRENSQPVNNPIITSTSMSDGYPSGAALIDTSNAKVGETSTITVTATDPSNGTTTSQSFQVTVGTYAGPSSPAVNFAPFANPVTTTVQPGKSTQVALSGTSGYPSSSTPSTLSYALVSQPSHGTVTNFNPSTGTLTYTPNAGFSGKDTFQYKVNASGPQTTPATTTSLPATVAINVSSPVNTGAVRVVGNVLLVTPLPKVGRHVRNTIQVLQATPAGATAPVIEVYVNGQLDINQPSLFDAKTGNGVDSIIVFGSKASDRITIDPSVSVPTLVDGGHGGRNVMKSGGIETRMHGWFGRNTLIGGPGTNQMIGLAGRVKFRPSAGTDLIFAANVGTRTGLVSSSRAPGGTYYVYKKGRLIPVPMSNLYPHATGTTGTGTHHHKKKK